jgi:uncharacterized protein (DUF1778 family)
MDGKDFMTTTVGSEPAPASVGKTERIEARVSTPQKEILQRAADLEGRSLTDFVISSAQEVAKRVISEHEVLRLTARDSEVLLNALLNPPSANENLRRAARRHKQRRG